MNGIPALALAGEATAIDGKFKGQAVDIAEAFIATAKGQMVRVYGQFLKDSPKVPKLRADVEKIVAAVKPL